MFFVLDLSSLAVSSWISIIVSSSFCARPMFCEQTKWFPVASLESTKPTGQSFQRAGTFTSVALIAFFPLVHADTAVITLHIKHPTGMMTSWWVGTGPSLQICLLCYIKCCKSSKKHRTTPGNTSRLRSGSNSAGGGRSPQAGSGGFMPPSLQEGLSRLCGEKSLQTLDVTIYHRKKKWRNSSKMENWLVGKRQIHWRDVLWHPLQAELYWSSLNHCSFWCILCCSSTVDHVGSLCCHVRIWSVYSLTCFTWGAHGTNVRTANITSSTAAYKEHKWKL